MAWLLVSTAWAIGWAQPALAQTPATTAAATAPAPAHTGPATTSAPAASTSSPARRHETRRLLVRLIEKHGYWALFVGTLLEGETVLVLAGFAARRGHLTLSWVILIATVGTLICDQTLFYVGRRKGMAYLQSKPKWHGRLDLVLRLMRKYGDGVVLSFRFLYGFRSVAPLAIGASGYPPLRYSILNVIAAVVWAVAVAFLGYLFGAAMEATLTHVRRYEHLALLALAAVGATIWLITMVRSRRRRRRLAEQDATAVRPQDATPPIDEPLG
jgi:membrane protein DedA with SNARE-associated domain